MEYIDRIINSISSIFDVSEDSISSLKTMLSEIDESNLSNRFANYTKKKNYSTENIIAKVNILNALMEIILENPNLEKMEDKEKKKILTEVCSSSAMLYEQIITNNDGGCLMNARCLAMYSMLSYMADQQTVSDIFVNRYISVDCKKMPGYLELSLIDQLELRTLYLVIMLLSNLKNQDGLLRLNNEINNTSYILENIQNEQIEIQEIDTFVGIKTVAFANLIYLISMMRDYLFAGRIKEVNNQDIYGIIDMYSFNMFHLLENENIDLKIISHLIRYAFRQIAENSIWNIADKSPLIRKFIENNLTGNNRYIYTLLPSQREVISDVLTPKKSIIVCMPTSAGKSFLAEMQILFYIHNYRSGDFRPTVCYIVPTNALIDQVKSDLRNDFKSFDFCIETALPCYEVDELEDEFLTREHIDILVTTPEKLESLIRQNHKCVRNTRLVIMDEAHNIGDTSRGSKFELVLSVVKHSLKEANFLLLSPFIDNSDDINEWLADSARNTASLSVEWAPTRQYIGCNILTPTKTESYLEFYKSPRNHLVSNDVSIPLRLNPQSVKDELEETKVDDIVKLCVLLNDFLEEKNNTLVLCNGPGTAVKYAVACRDFFTARRMLMDIGQEVSIKQAIEIVKLECGDNDPLIECLKVGICYHHSGLSSIVKETIEDLIRSDKVKLIFATTTLAQGMNFPINTVIFTRVNLSGHVFSNAEFWNIAGRAGRAYKDKEGFVIVSYSTSAEKTRTITRKYIEQDIKEIISSLTTFFKSDYMINLDYNELRNEQNTPILSLLQYINHILNISYDYDISPDDINKVRGILTDSYLYHSLIKKEGYLSAQTKLSNFVTQYIRHVSHKKRDDLIKADELGITDISFSKVKSEIMGFINSLRQSGDTQFMASDIILKTKDANRLAEIIAIIARIPEIKLEMVGQGILDPDAIAKLLLGWVNGRSVKDIAMDIKRQGQSDSDVISLCNRYLNSQVKSYMPWGINIYQSISLDNKTENAKMLPSYIYYGVSSKEAVIISKIGVPRFAINNVLQVLRSNYNNIQIDSSHISEIRAAIERISAEEYNIQETSGSVIKQIVDNRIKA